MSQINKCFSEVFKNVQFMTNYNKLASPHRYLGLVLTVMAFFLKEKQPIGSTG